MIAEFPAGRRGMNTAIVNRRICNLHNEHKKFLLLKRIRETKGAAVWKLRINEIMRSRNMLPSEFMPGKKKNVAAQTVH